MPEILVVDDEPGIRELMREILEEEGYEVRAAENGGALARPQRRCPLRTIRRGFFLFHHF